LSRGSIKQSETHLALQFPDQNTHAGGREKQPFRSAREALVLGDQMEGAELTGVEFH
jgi:hypothetical protein